MTESGLFLLIHRYSNFFECSCIRYTLRFVKITAPRIRRNILALNGFISLLKNCVFRFRKNNLTQNLTLVNRRSRIGNTLRLYNVSMPRLATNTLAQKMFLFFSILRCVGLRECSRTTSTLGFGFLDCCSRRNSNFSIHGVVRFPKYLTSHFKKNILTQEKFADVIFNIFFSAFSVSLRPMRFLRGACNV